MNEREGVLAVGRGVAAARGRFCGPTAWHEAHAVDMRPRPAPDVALYDTLARVTSVYRLRYRESAESA